MTITATAVVAVMATGAMAWAAIPDAAGVIHGCSGPTGQLRVINAPDQACQQPEQALDWNQRGPQGPVGAPGQDGAAGLPGPPGASGLSQARETHIDRSPALNSTQEATLFTDRAPAGAYVATFTAEAAFSSSSDTEIPVVGCGVGRLPSQAPADGGPGLQFIVPGAILTSSSPLPLPDPGGIFRDTAAQGLGAIAITTTLTSGVPFDVSVTCLQRGADQVVLFQPTLTMIKVDSIS